jgi:outer membrane protein assembly factor BamB
VVEFVRLDASGKQVARFAVDMMSSGGRIEVLPNGRVLAPLWRRNKVVEYDAAGKEVWQADFAEPIAAVRLPNGHTVVTSYQDSRAVELDGAGKPVWEFKADSRVTRAWRR